MTQEEESLEERLEVEKEKAKALPDEAKEEIMQRIEEIENDFKKQKRKHKREISALEKERDDYKERYISGLTEKYHEDPGVLQRLFWTGIGAAILFATLYLGGFLNNDKTPAPQEKKPAAERLIEPEEKKYDFKIKDGALHIPRSIDGIVIDNVEGYRVNQSILTQLGTFKREDPPSSSAFNGFKMRALQKAYQIGLDAARKAAAEGFKVDVKEKTYENTIALEAKITIYKGAK